jgi:hypothetical protein
MSMPAAQLIAEIVETAKANNRTPPARSSLLDLPVSTLQDILVIYREPDTAHAPPKPGKATMTRTALRLCRWEPCSKEFRPDKGKCTAYCCGRCRELAEIARHQKSYYGEPVDVGRVLRLKARADRRRKRQNKKD